MPILYVAAVSCSAATSTLVLTRLVQNKTSSIIWYLEKILCDMPSPRVEFGLTLPVLSEVIMFIRLLATNERGVCVQ